MTTLDYVREVRTLLPRRIVDGDTWWCYVDLGYRQLGFFEYRLAGWDTPELRGEGDWEKREARRAISETSDWWQVHIRAPHRRIFIRSNPDPEKYGRWLGDLWAETPAGEEFHLGPHLAVRDLAVLSEGRKGTRWRDTYGG